VKPWRSDHSVDEELAAARWSQSNCHVSQTIEESTGSGDELVGQVVEGRYLIEAPLGRGAMGRVYRARHVKVGREVAIKVLHDHLVADASMVARFDREAALAAKLNHRNLVSVIDVGETGASQKLMVLELARGRPLAELVAHGPLGRARTVNLVRQLLHGLAHAHASLLVHRDLKPENVIVDVDRDGLEVPKIVDFGIAVLRGRDDAGSRRLTETGFVLGTPVYMAPEQAQGAAPDPRGDLFALGVMVYEMLTGRQPFSGTAIEIMLANISCDPPAMTARAPDVAIDPLLEAFARRLMARRLCERFASAREALEVLEQIERDPGGAMAALGIPGELDGADTQPMVRVRPRIAMPPIAIAPVAAPVAVAAAPGRGRWTALGLAVVAVLAALVLR
jgi:eukaryotic-like serine/threonine-protein kinase